MCSLPDIEKELARVKQENKNLRDALGNKLLLEEQVFDLKTRLEKYDEISTDTVALKVSALPFSALIIESMIVTLPFRWRLIRLSKN